MTEQPDALDNAMGTDPAVDGSGDSGNPGELYPGNTRDDEAQPQDTGDSLTDQRDVIEPLDEGYSPPEKWSAGQKWGNTPLEEELGETLDMRLEQEIPEPDPYEQPEAEAAPVDGDGDRVEDEFDAGLVSEVGDVRAGRLVEPDEGVRAATAGDPDAADVGIDGAAASAEEAAVHVLDEEDV